MTDKAPVPPIAPTPADVWREGELIRLPGCGHVARLKRPSLTALAGTTNGVPNPLSPAVLRLIAGRPTTTLEERIENVKSNSRAFMEVAALCLIEPRLVLDGEPGPGEIGPQDLSDTDYTWIYYTYVEGVASEVVPFRLALGASTD